MTRGTDVKSLKKIEDAGPALFFGLVNVAPTNPVPTVPVVPKNCCQAFIFNY